MNIWLHRISHHAELSYPLLERGYLSIGFSDFRYKDFIRKTQSEGWGFFEQSIAEMWNSLPRTRYNLWRFVAEMQVADWVLVPSWGVFSVYQIIGDAIPIGEADIAGLTTWHDKSASLEDGLLVVDSNPADLGLVRPVKPIATNISRNDFADAALTARMKIRTTNANITDLRVSVEDSVRAFQENAPINLHAQISDAARNEVLKLIRKSTDAKKFEQLIEWYFRKIGASTVWIPAKNESGKEGDADVVAVFENLKTIYYVQAKFHEGNTSDWATQQIRDYVEQKNAADDGYAKVGWVVTTGDGFSEESMNLAKEHSILLFAGKEFAQMILEAGIENLDKAF